MKSKLEKKSKSKVQSKSSKIPKSAPAKIPKSAAVKKKPAKSVKATLPKVEKAKTVTPPKKKSSKANTTSTDGPEPGLEEIVISVLKPGETKEKIWRDKSFEQFPAQKEFGFPVVVPELPSQFNESKLVLMPKDPEYMFCYWELTPKLLGERETEKLPQANYRETLKINWEAKSLFEPNFSFIPVFFWAKKWYFGVPQIGQSYQVELGWLSDSGHFIALIRSNLSELPESWIVTQKRLAEKGDVLAYASKHTKSFGSSEHLVVEDIRNLSPEWNLSSESFSSSSWSRGASQKSSSESVSANLGNEPPAKGVSLGKRSKSTKAKLEISGKVLLGTQIEIDGKRIPLDMTGRFQTEFPFDTNVLTLQLIGASGIRRSLTYDLKELVLT